MTQTPHLSYASYFESRWKRGLVRTVEHASGQAQLQRLYETYRRERSHEPFFTAAIELLNLDIAFDAQRLAQIPAMGPLVVVANHPFGVLDGLVVAWLVSRRRNDFAILTNAVLDGAPEIRNWLLPIDFSGTRSAQAVNLASRAESLSRLAQGGCIVVFPAGGVSTAPTPFARAAVDDSWKPFTARLISRSGAQVAPIFFEGQNSRLFQIASHISIELRLALIFHEVRRRMGTRVPVQIGETLGPETLHAAGRRHDLMAFLRARTYGLAPARQHDAIARAVQQFQARKPAIFR